MTYLMPQHEEGGRRWMEVRCYVSRHTGEVTFHGAFYRTLKNGNWSERPVPSSDPKYGAPVPEEFRVPEARLAYARAEQELDQAKQRVAKFEEWLAAHPVKAHEESCPLAHDCPLDPHLGMHVPSRCGHSCTCGGSDD